VFVCRWGFIGGEGAVFLPDPSVANIIGLGVFLKILNSVTKVGGSMKYSVKNKKYVRYKILHSSNSFDWSNGSIFRKLPKYYKDSQTF